MSAGNGGGSLRIDLPAALVEKVAERAAEILAERQGENTEPGFLGVEGAAAFLSCPKSRVYRLVSAGRVPHHRDGSRLLFDRDELRQFVRTGGAKTP